MVLTAQGVVGQVLGQNIFSAEQLAEAEEIVKKLLAQEINLSDYSTERNCLASKTSNPQLMILFMDCHPLRKFKNADKIQVLVN